MVASKKINLLALRDRLSPTCNPPPMIKDRTRAAETEAVYMQWGSFSLPEQRWLGGSLRVMETAVLLKDTEHFRFRFRHASHPLRRLGSQNKHGKRSFLLFRTGLTVNTIAQTECPLHESAEGSGELIVHAELRRIDLPRTFQKRTWRARGSWNFDRNTPPRYKRRKPWTHGKGALSLEKEEFSSTSDKETADGSKMILYCRYMETRSLKHGRV